jgi:hypothetical protein
MAYVPGFRYDLFISYASADNVDGWVEEFEKRLTAELHRLLGHPFSDKTVLLDLPSHTLTAQSDVEHCALLVVLLSNAYLNDGRCAQQFERFKQRVASTGTLAHSLAVVRVGPCDALPGHLQDAAYEDFVIPEFENPWEARTGHWMTKVNRLAVQIKASLQKLRSRAGAVFVGPTLDSDPKLRERVEDYLAAQRFRAVPSVGLLDDENASLNALTEAKCSVHFLGNAGDLALNRLEQATKYCPGPTVTFQPFGAELSGAETQFLGDIDPTRYPQRTSRNETEFKQFLDALLTSTRQAATPTSAGIGVICEPPDFDAISHGAMQYPRFLNEKLSSFERLREWKAFLRANRRQIYFHGITQQEFLNRIWRLSEEAHAEAIREWFLAHPDLDTKRQNRPGAAVFPDDLQRWLGKLSSSAGQGTP